MQRQSKFLSFIVSFFFTGQLLSCPNEQTIRHINSDGSIGGLKSVTAKVSEFAHIDPNAKVCNEAWVESGVQVLDESTVSGNAWVKQFVQIKGKTTVTENAVIEGLHNGLPTIIEGRAEVKGNSIILAGSLVSDDAEISGMAILKNVSVKGKSKICGKYVISNQDISNSNFFCRNDSVISKTSLKIDFKNDQPFYNINQPLSFSLINGTFAKDVSNFIVEVNGLQLNADDIDVQSQRLQLSADVQINNGKNKVSLLLFDSFGHKVEHDFEFYAGEESLNINLGRNSFFTTINVHHDEYRLELRPRFFNGRWVVENIPNEFLERKADFVIANENGYFIYDGLLQDIDTIKDLIPFSSPSQIDNNDFSRGLDGWEVSHPDQVFISNLNNERIVNIEFVDDSQIELKRTYLLNSQTLKLFLLPKDLSLVSSHKRKYQVVVIGRKSQKIFNQFVAFDLNDSLEEIKKYNFGVNNEDLTFIIRFFPNPNKHFSSDATVINQAPEIEGINVDFVNPAFFLQENQSLGKTLPVNPDDSSVCSNEVFDVLNGPISKSFKTTGFKIGRGSNEIETLTDPLEYLSVGPASIISPNIENRLFGNMIISNVSLSDIENVYLELKYLNKDSNGIEKIMTSEIPLAVCARNQLKFSAQANLMKYLARLDYAQMASLPIYRDQRISITPVLKISNRPPIKGNTQKLRILRALSFDNNLNYSDPSKIDYYDVEESGFLRSGGDKWIRHTIGNRIEKLLPHIRQFSEVEWKVNDAARINGGVFTGHQIHNDGQDVDIRFENVAGKDIPDFVLTDDRDKNFKVLGQIENFLFNSFQDLNFIRDIYLTAPEESDAFKYFHNRCISGRVIDLLESKNGTGTFLLNRENHTDHLHLRYHSPDDNGGIKQVLPPTQYNFIGNHFWFGIENGKFWIRPKTEYMELYQNVKIRWTIRNHSNRYDSSSLEYGEYSTSSGKYSSHIVRGYRKRAEEFQYADIVLENEEGFGGCHEMTNAFSFEMSKLCRTDDGENKIEDWTIHPRGGFVSRSATVDPNYQFGFKSYACNRVKISGLGSSGDNIRYEGDVELKGTKTFGVGGDNSIVKGRGVIEGQFTASNSELEGDFNLYGGFEFRDNTVIKSLTNDLLNIKLSNSGQDWYLGSEINSNIESIGSLNLLGAKVKSPITNSGTLSINGYFVLAPIQNNGNLRLEIDQMPFREVNGYLNNTGSGAITLIRNSPIYGLDTYNNGTTVWQETIQIINSIINQGVTLLTVGVHENIHILNGNIASNRTIYSPYACNTPATCNLKKTQQKPNLNSTFSWQKISQ